MQVGSWQYQRTFIYDWKLNRTTAIAALIKLLFGAGRPLGPPYAMLAAFTSKRGILLAPQTSSDLIRLLFLQMAPILIPRNCVSEAYHLEVQSRKTDRLTSQQAKCPEAHARVADTATALEAPTAVMAVRPTIIASQSRHKYMSPK